MNGIIIIKCQNMSYLLSSENALSDHQIFNIVSLIGDVNDIDRIIKKIFDKLGICLKQIPIIAEIKINHS